MKSKQFCEVIESLELSRTEDEIVKILTKIVKDFNINLYRNIILTNPYYKSLFVDVKENITREISIIRNSIVDEISEISKEIKNCNTNNVDKLKELKRDCVSLLYEINEREKDISRLI